MDPIKHIYPLTPVQEGIYFHSVDANSTAYFEQVEYEVTGELDVALLELSVTKLFERHDILRTNFVHKPNHRILQVVSEQKSIDFHSFDWRDADDPDARLSSFKAADIKRGFDLKRDVLFRVNVFRLSDNDYRVVCSNHHILLDGWSRAFILTDLFEIYKALKNQNVSSLRQPRSFRDYVAAVSRIDLDSSGQYWKEYLRDLMIHVKLGDAIRTSTPTQTYEVAQKSFAIPSEQIQLFCGRHGYTVNSFINTVWALTLSILTDSHDLVFGVVLSGRSADVENSEEYIGLLINTLPIRVKVDVKENFHHHAQKVQKDFMEHERHQRYPLKSILAFSRFRQHLIDHLVAFENYPIFSTPEAYANDMSIVSRKTYQRSNYDLNVVISHSDRLEVLLNYNAAKFSQGLISGIVSLIKSLINIIIADASMPVEKIMQIAIQSLSVPLPAKRTQKSQQNTALEAPVRSYQASEVEKILLDIWQEELNLKTLTIHDNLFESGADSIMAIHVATKIKRMGYIYTPSSIYDHATIIELATVVSPSATLKKGQSE